MRQSKESLIRDRIERPGSSIQVQRWQRGETDKIMGVTNVHESLRFQFGTLKRGEHSKYLAHGLREHRAIIAATRLPPLPLRERVGEGGNGLVHGG
jgi:hypothetical protein